MLGHFSSKKRKDRLFEISTVCEPLKHITDIHMYPSPPGSDFHLLGYLDFQARFSSNTVLCQHCYCFVHTRNFSDVILILAQSANHFIETNWIISLKLQTDKMIIDWKIQNCLQLLYYSTYSISRKAPSLVLKKLLNKIFKGNHIHIEDTRFTI